jgi:hypothetical protein
MGWLGKQKVKHLNLGLHKISIERNDNLKTNLRWHAKMNACARFLKCSPYRRSTPLFDKYSNGEIEISTIENERP